MARPKVSKEKQAKPVSVSMPPDLHKKAKRVSEKQNISVSGLIRRLLTEMELQ
jgi:hypothetical protein